MKTALIVGTVIGVLLICGAGYNLAVYALFTRDFPDAYEMQIELMQWTPPDTPEAEEFFGEAVAASTPPLVPFVLSSADELATDPNFQAMHGFWRKRYGWVPEGLDEERGTRAALMLRTRAIWLFASAVVVFIALAVVHRIGGRTSVSSAP